MTTSAPQSIGIPRDSSVVISVGGSGSAAGAVVDGSEIDLSHMLTEPGSRRAASTPVTVSGPRASSSRTVPTTPSTSVRIQMGTGDASINSTGAAVSRYGGVQSGGEFRLDFSMNLADGGAPEIGVEPSVEFAAGNGFDIGVGYHDEIYAGGDAAI
ncbi:hypothetical protein M2280_005031 [Prescottella agglutinans]|uniref:Uncharacterized protein n=2 Tax=Prescottella agglutinans TaxID=1644129 RepID=A0ABT6MHR7_9NOCA|nr:hypothetical protein [Prescottella agglutinans]